jgi:SAM-dependent methyltransferase
MKVFERDDGTKIEVIPGFRERTLAYRRAISPRAHWMDDDYAQAAAKKRKRFQRIAEKARSFNAVVSGGRVLDVGCGDASNCLLFAESGAAQVDGIDLNVALFAEDEKGERIRQLARKLMNVGSSENVSDQLATRGVTISKMDATQMSFPDGTFDFVMSRSAMEHVRPLDAALREVARVTRPGGLIYLSIDPFYWVRGCHKRGVVDIPWAHARLTLSEFRRFVTAYEGEATALQRFERLDTLNRLTLSTWKERIAAMDCDILEWADDVSAIGQDTLREHPEVLSTLLPDITERDLLHERIRVWLKRRA